MTQVAKYVPTGQNISILPYCIPLTLFRDIQQSTERSRWSIRRTHECVQFLDMTGYVENSQFNAKECMTPVLFTI